MPRILRIINRLNLGGPTYNASYLSKYLAPEFETMLVAGQKDDTEASSNYIPESMGLQPVLIENMRREISPVNDYRAYLEIKRLIKKFKPDIVHTHAAKSGALGRLAAYNMNVPVILHTFHGHVFHSYFNRLKTRVFLEIERNLATKSSKIIAISQQQKKELCQEFRIAEPDKFEVIPLGFDLNKFQKGIEVKRKDFRTQYKIDDDEIAVGIIGRIVPVKNHGLFLNAIKSISSKTGKKVRYFIIGDGEDTGKIQQQATDLGIDWNWKGERKSLLTFTSWIKDIDVANAGLDIVTLTSLNEGTPVSLIEAQAANKPIVATEVGGVEDIIKPGETGLLCKSGDQSSFSGLLLDLIENENKRLKMGHSGYSHVSKNYSYNRLVEDMRELYLRLLNI
ncbi:MAG: glycosyltransferase [Chitinophagales bacterium]|nr:glycosyltransferase [Chitinophagales bacterium]